MKSFFRSHALKPVIGMLVVVFFPSICDAKKLKPKERKMVRYIENHADEAIVFLEKAVNTSSGTMNQKGVRAAGALFRREFDRLGFETSWIELPRKVNRAGHLFAEQRGTRGKKLILLGHLDTVFEKDSPFQTFERNGDQAKGPGIIDMKGGNVVILYALKALRHAGALKNVDITVALMGDEEKAGRPIEVSRGELIDRAQRADVALGFEPGREGKVVTARRGSSGWSLKVTGTRGHSSRIFSDKYGSGAIFEAARILTAFHDDVRGERYLTFNPGNILGGTEVVYDGSSSRGTAFGKSNVIAQTTEVHGGLRFISDEQKKKARARMREVVGSENLAGTSAEIIFSDAYPAMPPTEGNRTLLGLYDRVSRDLGYEAIGAFDPGSRGAADISFIASYVDGMDGLGVYGSGSHTTEETMDLTSFPVAAKRAAIMIFRLTR